MDWKREAMDELREYEAKKAAVQSIPEDIAQLKAEAVRMGGTSSNSVPVKGGGSAWEEKQINLIAKIEKLKTSLAVTRHWVKQVERGLALLNNEERQILERFYIRDERGAAERLAGELGIDVKTVYHRKDAALRKYTLTRFGCIES